MKVIGLSQVLEDRSARTRVIRSIREGSVFVYPTDTLYGIGCDATKPGPVRRIRELKMKPDGPFSVIAPSVKWIEANLVVSHKAYLSRLPGPFTLIMRMKKRAVCPEVSAGTLGIRIPDHPFTRIVQESGRPFVTTSVNKTGDTPAWSIDGIPEDIARGVDYVIDGGFIKNPPSAVIDLTGKTAKSIR